MRAQHVLQPAPPLPHPSNNSLRGGQSASRVATHNIRSRGGRRLRVAFLRQNALSMRAMGDGGRLFLTGSCWSTGAGSSRRPSSAGSTDIAQPPRPEPGRGGRDALDGDFGGGGLQIKFKYPSRNPRILSAFLPLSLRKLLEQGEHSIRGCPPLAPLRHDGLRWRRLPLPWHASDWWWWQRL